MLYTYFDFPHNFFLYFFFCFTFVSFFSVPFVVNVVELFSFHFVSIIEYVSFVCYSECESISLFLCNEHTHTHTPHTYAQRLNDVCARKEEWSNVMLLFRCCCCCCFSLCSRKIQSKIVSHI